MSRLGDEGYNSAIPELSLHRLSALPYLYPVPVPDQAREGGEGRTTGTPVLLPLSPELLVDRILVIKRVAHSQEKEQSGLAAESLPGRRLSWLLSI